MTVLELSIPTDLPPMRLDKYLARALPGLPSWALREAFSRRDVKMEGRRAGPDEPAQPGARVQVYGLPDREEETLEVVYEDEQILLINKPAGISVQQDPGGGACVETLALEHVLKTDPGALPPKACHRLDIKTCGLLLLAKTDKAQESFEKAFKERTVQKTYTCLVKGTPEPREACLHAFLRKDAAQARVTVHDSPVPGSLPVTTAYRVLEAGEVSRLEVDLITGRTHQIRAHLSHIGHPVLGDDLYGNRAFNRARGARRLMLCASGLTLWGEGELAYLCGRSFSVKVPF